MRGHCQNPKCFNFTSNTDLAGTWCCDECFIQFETGDRPTRKQLLQSKLDWKWTMDPSEINEAEKLGLTCMGVPR